MRAARSLLIAAMISVGAYSYAQGVPPIDHILINDARVFDISDDGASYILKDNPVTTAVLSLVQGAKGKLVGSVVLVDAEQNSYGPVSVAGKLAVKGTSPLTLTLSGGGKKGLPYVYITGTYNANVSLMNVQVSKGKTKNELDYTWNDAFVPTNALYTGILLDRSSVAKNARLTIKGQHLMDIPTSVNVPVSSQDTATAANTFVFKAKGVSVSGTYNSIMDQFTVVSAVSNAGYGSIITPGALVTCESDNLIIRQP